MSLKTLIIGARGMLGHELGQTFAKYNPTLWDISDIDITKKQQVDEKIRALSPELIINSAAYTAVDKCEENEALATKVNGEAVGFLAEVAHCLGATLVHYSTDYVFDGKKKEGYKEDDEPNPINAYGRSKLIGEQSILSLRAHHALDAGGAKQSDSRDEQNTTTNSLHRDDKIASVGQYSPPRNDNPRYYIIRTAWLYGAHGKNFVETMLSLAKKGQPIKVIDDQVGSPTYAVDLAQATRDIVETHQPYGIYHRTNEGQCSWHEFAKEIFSVFNVKADLSGCATKEYPLPAKRPAYSVLRSTKLEPMRDWKKALRAYAENR